MDNNQRCSRCEEIKPLTAFARSAKGSETRNRYCLVCARDYRREHYGKSLTPNPRTRPGASLPAEWRCPECGIVKPVTDYYRKQSAPKGFETPCKGCMRESERNGRRRGNIEKYRRSEKGRDRLRRYEATPEQRARRNKWLAGNVERVREIGRMKQKRRMARLAGLLATLTQDEWLRAVEYFGGDCAYCGRSCEPVQEHFIPLAADGPFTAGNIVPACQSCNCSKRSRMPQDWCSPEAYQRILAYFASLK